MAKKKQLTRKWFHLSFFGMLMGVTLVMFGFQVAFAGKVAPNTFALNTNISFEEAEKVQEEYSEALEAFEVQPVLITFKGEIYEFNLEELGVNLLKTESVQEIPIINPAASPWSLELGKEVEAQFELDEEQMAEGLNTQIINLVVAPEEPLITWNPYLGDFDILPEQTGWEADLAGFQEVFEQQIGALSSSLIEIVDVETLPQITAAELEAEKDLLQEKLTQVTTIFTDTDEWDISWRDNIHLLNFEAVEDQLEGPTIVLEVDRDIMTEHISMYIAPDIEVSSQDATILMDEEGNISFEDTAVDGLAIEYDNLNEFLEIALNQGIEQVEVPLEVTQGQVNAPDELKERGITELVVTGYSNYYGSPYNRRHNISVAIDQFNGVMVEPGETFVFGDTLGVVDGTTGYAKELVIKENETIPEYGGGVCQVSSTLFRAILFGGFPIVERHAHSYAVSYYAYPLGWGLDATVYPPAVDLQFTNDMETPILIQSYVEGNDAYYKFYGTKDGRQVDMDGPYTSNARGAPAAIYTVTDELEAGVIEQKDSAHNGFTATWTRTVTYPEGHPQYPDGHVIEEEIISPYQAWPARYLVGEGTEGYGEEDGE